MHSLSPHRLSSLPLEVTRPQYPRNTLRGGIVHLGVGAFQRAHLAVVTEAAIHRTEDLRWGIVGVSLRHPETRDALEPQEGLYTVSVRDADEHGRGREVLQVVGNLLEILVAPESPEAVLERIAHPDTRIVSLTITEKGYCPHPATGDLQFDHQDIQHDLSTEHAPRSAIGFIVRGLQRRWSAGSAPLTLLSLDNLPHNGATLKGLVLAFAERIGARLGVHDAWPVVTEPFCEWVMEDQFVAGRPQWEVGGARVVADVAPYETLKLRMVNGTHSALAYLAVVAGYATVDRVIAQPVLRHYLATLMREEIEPTLPTLEELDLKVYHERLLSRYANPALRHSTQHIAMDGSQKLPQRLLGTIRDRLRMGVSIERLALAVAAWLHYLGGVDEAGNAYEIQDPLAELLTLRRVQAQQACAHILDPKAAEQRRITVFTDIEPIFGGLSNEPRFIKAVARHTRLLRDRGVLATVEALA